MDTTRIAKPIGPPPGAAADLGPFPQGWLDYTSEEHMLWDRLFLRQAAMLLRGRRRPSSRARGCASQGRGAGFRRAQRAARQAHRLVGGCRAGAGARRCFFEHLANRRFVAGGSCASPTRLDYLEAPDIFHDVFGHVPLLSDPVFADYMQAYGEGGLARSWVWRSTKLARLYWYTVEFGLIAEPERLRLYGAGILLELWRVDLRAGRPVAEPHRLRSQAPDAHPLSDRRLPADLFRHRQFRQPGRAQTLGSTSPRSTASFANCTTSARRNCWTKTW